MVLLAQALFAGGVDESHLDDASRAELKLMQMTTDLADASSTLIMGATGGLSRQLLAVDGKRERAHLVDELARAASARRSQLLRTCSDAERLGLKATGWTSRKTVQAAPVGCVSAAAEQPAKLIAHAGRTPQQPSAIAIPADAVQVVGSDEDAPPGARFVAGDMQI